MASAAIFSSLRRRRSPSIEAFLASVDLADVALLETLAAVSAELISVFSGKTVAFQEKNSRSLIRKIEVFVVLIEFVCDSGLGFPLTANLCFKEMYLLLYRLKILLDYYFQSSKLLLLLQNHTISGHFHDLNQEILTLMDVFRLQDLNLDHDDVREQIELLKRQSKREKLFIDKHDESLRLKLYSFLNEFENGKIPNPVELYTFFVEKLGICDVRSCKVEIVFLEEQTVNHEGDVEPNASVLNGFVALTRYFRFLLFGFEGGEVELEIGKHKKPKKSSMMTKCLTTLNVLTN